MDEATKERILAKAKEEGNRWLEAFHLDGIHDIPKIHKVLRERTFEDEPVFAVVGVCPEEAAKLVFFGAWMMHLVNELGAMSKLGVLLRNTAQDIAEAYLALDMENPQRLLVQDGGWKEFMKFDNESFTELVQENEKKVTECYKRDLPNIEPHRCIWDYYSMAFYESAAKAAEISHPFIDQSLFEPFQDGLGYVINLGSLIIGVCLPDGHRDEENRIHRQGGPAITWGDKERFFWHGVEVEADWIYKRTDPSQYWKITNQEQRRCFAEIYEWDAIVATTKYEEVHTDEYGTLIRIPDFDEGEDGFFVRVSCPSTDRKYSLRVAPGCKTAHEGVASTFDIETAEYNPVQQT